MTDNGKQYAEALFDLAREDDVAGEIARGLDLVMDAFVRTPEYVQFLDSPAVPRDERTAAVESAFSDLVHPYVVSTVCLMTRKGQIQDFDECVREYRLLYRDSVRHAEARVCSAAKLSDLKRSTIMYNRFGSGSFSDFITSSISSSCLSYTILLKPCCRSISSWSPTERPSGITMGEST